MGKSSEMWATGLKSVTMTILADKFCFKGNFYVSVVVLPDDGECRRHKKFADECILDNRMHDTSSMIEKEVTVKITKVLDESAYVAPIVSALITMGGLILTSYLVVGFKSCEDLVK